MEKLVIKIINKTYRSNKDLKNLNRYVVGKGMNKNRESVRYYGSKGVSKNIEEASNNMIQILDWSKRPGTRKVYHVMISFPDYIEDVNIIRIAIEEVANAIFDDGYCLIYGIHESKKNLHAHFSILAVNYQTNRKWHMNRNEFKMWKKDMQECIEDILIENHIKLFS